MPRARILIVDDEPSLAWFLSQGLEGAGYETLTAETGEAGLEAFEGGNVDLLLLDVNLPGISGVEVLEKVQESSPGTPVLMISAYDQAEVAVRCLKAGALDYIQKPLQLEELLHRVRKVLRESRRDRLEEIARRDPSAGGRERPLVGRSSAMERVRKLIRKASAGHRTTILITGESGTGKELVARALHQGEGPFVAVNCTAIPENLLESELFGHEKGAFTDARETRKGYFELAHGGTLFLDEVGDLPLAAQAKLLRVLQEKVVQRVGGHRSIPVDVHVVAATNRRLEEAITGGEFRDDLYYRLNVFPIELPPLREREDDVVLLAETFLEQLGGRMGGAPVRFSPEALEALVGYPWPGNIRELENVVERSLLLSDGGVIEPEDLGLQGAVPRAGRDPVAPMVAERLTLEELEKRYVLALMEEFEGRRGEVAGILGIDPKTLYRKLKKWDAAD